MQLVYNQCLETDNFWLRTDPLKFFAPGPGSGYKKFPPQLRLWAPGVEIFTSGSGSKLWLSKSQKTHKFFGSSSGAGVGAGVGAAAFSILYKIHNGRYLQTCRKFIFRLYRTICLSFKFIKPTSVVLVNVELIIMVNNFIFIPTCTWNLWEKNDKQNKVEKDHLIAF